MSGVDMKNRLNKNKSITRVERHLVAEKNGTLALVQSVPQRH